MEQGVAALLTALGLPPAALAVLALVSIGFPIGMTEWLKGGPFGIVPPLKSSDAPFVCAVVNALAFGVVFAAYQMTGAVIIMGVMVGATVGFTATGLYGLHAASKPTSSK